MYLWKNLSPFLRRACSSPTPAAKSWRRQRARWRSCSRTMGSSRLNRSSPRRKGRQPESRSALYVRLVSTNVLRPVAAAQARRKPTANMGAVMKTLSVALLQSDSRIVRALAASLCHHFQTIRAASSIEQLREIVVRHRSELVIVDLEMASMSEIARLHRDFTGVCIVCTHRLADEEIWTAAMNAGASDLCPTFDTRTIVDAALRSESMGGSIAA